MENKTNTKDSILLSNIYSDTCTIIEDARDRAYRAINTALTIRNWMIGERIAREHLGDDGRAEYGKYIISSLAEMLTKKYGKGFDTSSLHRYVKFYNLFPAIVATAQPQLETSNNQAYIKEDAVQPQLLPWSHYKELIGVENNEARNWYAKEAASACSFVLRPVMTWLDTVSCTAMNKYSKQNISLISQQRKN